MFTIIFRCTCYCHELPIGHRELAYYMYNLTKRPCLILSSMRIIEYDKLFIHDLNWYL